jgi:hypothetical protein
MASTRSTLLSLFAGTCIAVALSAQPAFAQCNGGAGNGVCEPGESCDNCYEDCFAFCCPDGGCQAWLGEDCSTCSADCGACCPNGACDHGETQSTCCQDCGCPSGQTCQSGACVSDPCSCGDTHCNCGETSVTCCQDCGASCGDGACNCGENQSNCCADCGCPSGSACTGGTCVALACPWGQTCDDHDPCTSGDHCLINNVTCHGTSHPCGTCQTCDGAGGCLPTPNCCGNGTCEPATESHTSCAADCSDFYVRDWTDSAAVHDDGAQPSIRADAWHTCDVWNRQSNDPAAFVSDAPDGEDAVVTPGHNYAFVRVHRNAAAAAGSPAVTVSAEFFRARAGLGANFVSLGAPETLTFNAADTVWTPAVGAGYDWVLPGTASGDMCLAVEIGAPGDPAQAPGILGGMPGAGMRQDNNKAQRNLAVETVPSPWPGPLPPSPKKLTFQVLVHNPGVRTRDMRVELSARPEVVAALGEAEVAIVGGARQRLAERGALVLPRVRPGENRWLTLTVDAPTRPSKDKLQVHAVTDADAAGASGFTFEVRQGSLDELVRRNVLRQEALTKRAEALNVAPRTQRLAARSGAPVAKEAIAYDARIRQSLPWLEGLAEGLAQHKSTATLFPMKAELAALKETAKAGDAAALALAQARVLGRLDALLTARDLADGDEADILQTMRWQATLIQRLRLTQQPFAAPLLQRGQEYVKALLAHKAGFERYPHVVNAMLPELRRLVEQLTPRLPNLRQELGAVEANLESPQRLQGAHRQLLLRLEDLAER